jgi:hypothetical protein
LGELTVSDLARHLALNAAGITVLAYVLYFRRHRRRDLLIGYVALNACLFSVTSALGSSSPLSLGVGFGLFAVLSIVRLRSDEMTQAEIGYTMSSLVLGLLSGLPGLALEVKALLVVLLVTTMYVVDHPHLVSPYRHVRFRVVLETVHADPGALVADLEGRLRGVVKHYIVKEIDYVRETMTVDVRLLSRVDASAAVPGERDITA